MPFFRTKPVVIEARQLGRYLSMQTAEVIRWVNSNGGNCLLANLESEDNRVFLTTLEGVMSAAPGDWIIKGVANEFYPRRPDIFATTYEPVALTDPTKDDLQTPEFNAVWNAIKRWDIDRGLNEGWSHATGTDVMTILNALAAARG